MSTKYTAHDLESPTGATLRLYRALPAGKLRAVVQVNHGLAEHAARYERFAQFLASRGFATYAHDHRGHGYTTAPDAPPRKFAPEAGAAKAVLDTEAVHAHVASEHPGIPVITFGHSMGGLVALNHAVRFPGRATALAVWNANFSAGFLGRLAKAILAWERARLGHDMPSRILPKLTFGAWAKSVKGRKTDFDWLSRDADEVAAYVADPLCGWDASVAMWQDVFTLIFAGADDANLKKLPQALPVNLLGGGQDPATNGGRAVTDLAKRMRAVGMVDVTGRIREDFRHESLNEVGREGVMEDFAAWAVRAVSPQGS